MNRIDQLTKGAQWKPAEVDIIEAAFWARSVLEIIENVEFQRYGHQIETTIRTTHSVNDPVHLGNAKAVYTHNQNISFKQLLGVIIHFRYFSFDRFANGNNCLAVMSDRNVIQQVYYSDFTSALRTLVLPRRLVALAICDMVEQDLLGMAKESWRHTDAWLFPSINFFSLLYEHVKSETELKLRIMDEIFSIAKVPDEVLPELAFFPSRFGPGDNIVIGFGPTWENEQDTFSPLFDQGLLFDLIRKFYWHLI
ncbi:MAG: hypothetical protein OXG25_09055 [Gammaproteobacteria bacterium]|nr:hypothetical protein [Gammaproteobacteria bacterium]